MLEGNITTNDVARFHVGDEVVLAQTGARWIVSALWRWEEEWFYDLYQPGSLKCGIRGCELMPPQGSNTAGTDGVNTELPDISPLEFILLAGAGHR